MKTDAGVLVDRDKLHNPKWDLRQPKPNGRSLFKDLTLGLLLVICSISAFFISANYIIITKRTRFELDQKADEYLARLVDSLELPLWTVDREGIRKICHSYAEQELVSRLRVMEPDGKVVFKEDKNDDGAQIFRKRTIVHSGHVLGIVELALTTKFSRQAGRRLLWSSMLLMLIVIAVLLATTGILLRVFLEKPISELLEGIDRITEGDYDYEFRGFKQKEIGEIAAKFNRMVEQVKIREKNLGQVNERLEKEILEHARAREAVSAAEEKYHAIFENAVEGIYQTTPEGRFLAANPAMARMLGYTPHELASKLTGQLYVTPRRRDEFIEEIDRQGFVKGFKADLYRKDGSSAVVSINSRAVRDRKANLLYFEGFIEDITESDRLEKELLQAQKMEAVGTLAGGIAHDFNNLLQAILGYTQILLLDREKGDPDCKRLREIEKSAQRASELTQQLLTFSRKVKSQLRPIDLNQEVRQVYRLLNRTIPKMIEIELHLGKDLAIINGDPAQIEQVMMNLGVNARDAMPGGGKLVIETGNVTPDEDYCKIHLGGKAGSYVLLSISDTGCGIDKETLTHIFEPFFTTKEVGRGTGLGLAMAYGIVKSHGGYIMCYSEPGEGTLFKIYFPVAAMQESGRVESPVVEREIRGGSETILLADDEVFLRSLGQEMLSKYGYQVLIARDGEQALDIYREKSEDVSLVILDLIMPGMGGKRCLEKLLEMNPSLKVLISSGYSVSGPTQATLEAGARGFIRKPYELRQMLQVIRDVLES